MRSDEANADFEDARLMKAVAQGDMAAFGALVRRHQQRVRTVAFRFTGRWDVADDIAQEAFLRVLRSAPTYTPSASYTTWLYRIIANLCLDESRRHRLLRLTHEDIPARDDTSTDEPLLHDEAVRSVQREVAALPDRQRLAVILHRFDGLDHAEIAKVTGWTEPAIESLLHRAYAQLRARLREWADA